IAAVVGANTTGTTIVNTATVSELSSIVDNQSNNSSTATITVASAPCTQNCGGGNPPCMQNCGGGGGGGGGGGSLTLTIQPTSLPDGVVGGSYNQSLSATGNAGGPFTWSVSTGTLPTGLALNVSSTGITTSITGTPTAAGTYSFTVQVSNGIQTATQPY